MDKGTGIVMVRSIEIQLTSLSNLVMLIFRYAKRFVPLGIKRTYNGGENRTYL